MRLAPLVAACLLALALTGAAPGGSLLPAQRVLLAGIDRAAKHKRIDPRSAADDRAIVNRTAHLVLHLPDSRSSPLSSQLGQAAAQAHRLTGPRARAIFGQLAANNAYLLHRNPPLTGTDVTDSAGVVYRYFSGRGFEFHPLGNFAALNALVLANDAPAAERLADALIERAIPLRGGGSGWEYYFDFGGGRAPWLSGMAQAAAAQAFAGTAGLAGGAVAARYMRTARAAYRAIPGRLVMRVAAGPWIRLYAFSSEQVLNAQLQSALSLAIYGKAAGDASATALADRLRRAAATDLHRFDTGYWTYYDSTTLSPLDYQQYVVQLLRRLAPTDPRFASAAVRFASYEKQPPAFRLASAGVGRVRFWLSKPASVAVRSSAGPTRYLSLNGGWYDVGWPLPSRAGSFAVHLSARDWAGNSASVDALPIIHVVPASAARAVQADAAIGQPEFAAGVALDTASQAKLAHSRGFDTVRLSIPWAEGAAVPDAATVGALQSIRGSRIVLELVAASLPADDAGRNALAASALALVQQAPGIQDILLGPPPTVATAPAYVAALGAIRAAVHTTPPAVATGGELDGSKAPGATLAALGQAFDAAGLTGPVMDELAFRPAGDSGKTAWTLADYPKLVAALGASFGGTAQPGATLPILADDVAVGTRIPAAKAGLYSPPPGGGVAEATQASDYTQTLQTASCLPTLAGVLLGRLVDGPAAGQQSGLYYADGTAKTSARAVGKAAAQAARGVLQICPGLGVPAIPSTLTFPDQISRSTPPSVKLGCVRDCLYLVTLEHVGDGRPVLAARGTLKGGAAAATIRLPSAPYPSGSYGLVVRLVAQTNPGPIRVVTGPVFAVN